MAFRKYPADRRTPRPVEGCDPRPARPRRQGQGVLCRPRAGRGAGAGADDADADRDGAARRRAPGVRDRHRGPQRRLSAAPSRRSGLRDDRRVPHARDELSGRQGHPWSDDRQDDGERSAEPSRISRPATSGVAAANETAIGGAPLDEATRLAAEPKTLDAAGSPRTAQSRPRRRRARSSRSTSSSSSSRRPARRASRSTATRVSAR